MRAGPILALLASLALAVPAIAQEASAPAALAPEEKAVLDRAGLIFTLFASEIRDEDVSADEKNGLIRCLYAANLEEVSRATGEVLAKNPQIDTSKPINIYIVAAIVCGAREPGASAETAPQAPAE